MNDPRALDVLRAIRDLDLRCTDKMVLCALLSRADKDTWQTWASIETIARDAGLGVTATKAALRRLKRWAIRRPTNPGGARCSTVTTLRSRAIIKKGSRGDQLKKTSRQTTSKLAARRPVNWSRGDHELPKELPKELIPPTPQRGNPYLERVMHLLDEADETHRQALDDIRPSIEAACEEAAAMGCAVDSDEMYRLEVERWKRCAPWVRARDKDRDLLNQLATALNLGRRKRNINQLTEAVVMAVQQREASCG